jgi:hypothetical protein
VRRVGLTLLVVVVVAAAGVVALMAWASSEFTECYALFTSASEAEAAADDLAEAAPDLDVDLDSERRRGEVAAIFSTGATGDDARPLTAAFPRAVRARDGRLGHPGGGCRERGPIM